MTNIYCSAIRESRPGRCRKHAKARPRLDTAALGCHGCAKRDRDMLREEHYRLLLLRRRRRMNICLTVS